MRYLMFVMSTDLDVTIIFLHHHIKSYFLSNSADRNFLKIKESCYALLLNSHLGLFKSLTLKNAPPDDRVLHNLESHYTCPHQKQEMMMIIVPTGYFTHHNALCAQ